MTVMPPLPDANAPSACELFFLAGRGRSGTTLLAKMLNRNPAAHVPPESLFVMNLRARYARVAWSPAVVASFAREIWLEDRMRRWPIDPATIESRILGVPVEERSFRRACLEVYRAAAAATGKRDALPGDKNPHYGLFTGVLARIFPTARFIHLVRDYRDNIASYRSVRFDMSGVAALARRWVLYNQSVLDAAAREPARFHLLRFEDLVAEPVSQLRAMCGFLKIPYADSMLEFDRDDSIEAGLPWHSRLRTELDPSQSGKWKETLTPEEVLVADSICQPLGTKLGYAPASSGTATRAIAGSLAADAYTSLERLVFRLPLHWRIQMIRAYRRATGNIIE